MPALKRVIASLFTIIGIMILLKLGFWQVERLAWKKELITSLEKEYAKPVDEYPITAKNIDQILKDMPESSIYRGVITGVFDFSEEPSFTNAAPQNGLPGYNVMQRFMLDDEKETKLALGWVAYDKKEVTRVAVKKLENKVEALPVTIKKPAKNVKIYPYMLYADAYEPFKHIANGVDSKPVLRNKHKSYAIFWFTMAGVLFAFYIIFMIYSRKSK